MSGSVVRASTEEQGREEANSVFDFLYYDANRIGSFLAQFDPAGHLKAYKHSETAASGTNSTSQFGGKGTLGFASLDSSLGENAQESESAASESQYDPLWKNAISFLNFLEDRGLLGRSLNVARISQFVLASGDLEVVDLTMIKEMWSLPSVAQMVAGDHQPATQNRQQRRAAARSEGPSALPIEQQFGFDLLKLIPHSVQATVRSDEWRVWSSLRQDSMIVSPSDLFLKHGKRIPGRWNMVGIVDALPSDEEEVASAPSEQDATVNFLMSGAGAALDAIGPFARMVLGRPAAAYGMTPLLIFRQVQA